jgi:Flp pilus assembly protein TadG
MRAPHGRRGQSLVEFALVAPVLLLLVGGAVQYAFIIGAKHSLIQIARDTARWASTQSTYVPCDLAATSTPAQPLTRADELAVSAGLVAYAAGTWHGPVNNPPGNFLAGTTPLPATPPFKEGLEVAWTGATGVACPTADNSTTVWVTVRVSHRVPIFLPGAWFVPGLCDGSGCDLSLSSSAVYRMEPPPP